MKREYTHRLRVRYDECDPMGFVHHSKYLCYMEIARTELYRASGGNYARFEEMGLFVVVLKIECRYRMPARYDDELDVSVRIDRMTAAKIEQSYRICRGESLIAEAKVMLAVVDEQGRPQRIPEILRNPAGESVE